MATGLDYEKGDGSSMGIAIYEIRHLYYTQGSGHMAGANRAEFMMDV